MPRFSNPDAVLFSDNRRDCGETTRYVMRYPVGELRFQVADTRHGINRLIISARRGNRREVRLYAQRKHN